ncbi:MAG: peptidoglycan-binding protein [Actinomycetota bacterium]|nr:peptidoglycan-binding protein [Actinomycetota bacterium]
MPAVPESGVLRFGDRGPAVRALQRALARLRFEPGKADGVFATQTRAAVVAFQQANGLAPDGIVGPQTARALNDPGAKAAQPGLPTPGVTDPPDAAAARSGLAAAVASGRLSRREAARYDAILDRFLVRLSEGSGERAVTLAAVLHDVSLHSAVYDRPRALALFEMLDTNARYFAQRDPPSKMTDIAGSDGAIHRFIPGHGFQVHPLANFARLNALVAAGERERAVRLARAAVARAVRANGAFTWEYYFPFKGPSRWTSGMAQAVAAQALARTAALVDDGELAEAARGAYAAIPGKLVRPLAGGLWLREYGFSDIAILNSQLQAVLSIGDYAELADDTEARGVAEQLAAATRALLPRFDTGCWSLYSLGGSEASLSYQLYVVFMLRKLAAKRREPIWGEMARRWNPSRRARAGGTGCAAA